MKFVTIFILLSTYIFAKSIQVPTSFSAKFIQKITNPKKKVIQYSGTLLLNHSGALKWRYLKPTKKEVCSNGTTFTIVDHDLEQVSFYQLNKTLDLSSILKRAKHHKGDLYVATYQDILYTFSLDNKGRIEQIAYHDKLDNVVHIRFLSMRYQNKENPSKIMLCPYPSSYDIING